MSGVGREIGFPDSLLFIPQKKSLIPSGLLKLMWRDTPLKGRLQRQTRSRNQHLVTRILGVASALPTRRHMLTPYESMGSVTCVVSRQSPGNAPALRSRVLFPWNPLLFPCTPLILAVKGRSGRERVKATSGRPCACGVRAHAVCLPTHTPCVYTTNSRE